MTGGQQPARFYWYGQRKTYDPAGHTTGIHTDTDTDRTLTRAETYAQGQLTEIETCQGNNRIRTETYSVGQLIKVETFGNGRRPSSPSGLAVGSC